jgi:hypothetical protein
LAIARHDAADFSGVKVWKMKANPELTTFADYFATNQDTANLIATEEGPVQRTIKSGAANVNEDPILASNGIENNLAFNWKYSNNGARVVLTDVGHHSGTLSSNLNDDDNHGLGNTFDFNVFGWEHDASIIQGDCFGTSCTVQGTDHGSSFNTDVTSFGNYAFYVTQSSNGTCPLFVSLF